MKNQNILIIASAMFVASINASAQEAKPAETPAAKPIQYVFTTPDAVKLPFDVKPMGPDKVGCEITFLVTGENLTGIEDDAVNITSITAGGGKDITKNSRGRDAWKLDTFRKKVSQDGKYATFSVFVETETPLTSPNINGTVTVKTSGEVKTETLTFETTQKGAEQKAGPLTFAIDDYKSFQIRMKGNKNLISEIKIIAGGKTIKQQGWSGFNDQWTYTFSSAPTTPEFTLSVSYFDDVKDVVYKIGK